MDYFNLLIIDGAISIYYSKQQFTQFVGQEWPIGIHAMAANATEILRKLLNQKMVFDFTVSRQVILKRLAVE